jgi:hypothetical protein
MVIGLSGYLFSGMLMWPAELCVSHNTQMIKVKGETEAEDV